MCRSVFPVSRTDPTQPVFKEQMPKRVGKMFLPSRGRLILKPFFRRPGDGGAGTAVYS